MLALGGLLCVSACGGLLVPPPTPSAPDPTPSATPSATPTPSIEDRTLHDQSAVVRVTSGTCDGGGTGSGFVIDSRHVVTVAHVVEGATSIVVRRANGSRVARATVVGLDEKREVALLELDRDLKTSVELRFTTRAVKQLEPVGAIGYPLGGQLSTTTGQVTALDTRANVGGGVTLRGLIQFNAAISHGNSGGPLVGRDGRVAGLVEAERVGANDQYYAVPASTAAPLVQGWLADPDSVQAPDCPDTQHLVDITSVHPDAESVAISLENYFYGLDAKNETVHLSDDSTPTGYELADAMLTEDLAKKYPDAASLEAVYSGTVLDDVDLEKMDNTGPLEDWADVSWSNTTDGVCERHKARFTLRLDSGYWQLSSRHNDPDPDDAC